MRRVNAVVLSLSLVAGLISAGLLVNQGFREVGVNFTPDDELAEQIPEQLVKFYTQKPVWSDCPGSNSSARCGEVEVPLNWAKPEGKTIKIALAINPANDPENSPYLLMNPGGPGSSGIEWITDYINSLGTQRLRNNYNIVGFDPRGVGKSNPVSCLAAKQLEQYLYVPSPYPYLSKQDIEATKDSVKNFALACQKKTGELLAHVDTASAAKDMDVIRAVLGQKELNYLGYSYGTLLGATYAVLFPKKVGRFVLDGVVDPTTTAEEDSLNQLRGFTSAMKAYLSDCISNVSDCPFKGLTVTAAMNKISKDFLGVLEKGPITTSIERDLTLLSGFTGIISALYSKDSWQYLNQGFEEFFSKKKDGRIFLYLADSYFSFDPDKGSFSSNINEAFKAISCLDGREADDDASMQQQNKRALEIDKVFGRYWQYGGLFCHAWPYPVIPLPEDYSAKGAPTMMVIGTTNDPATPYSQAKNFAEKVLADAYLLTYEGEGHTAYGSSNTCVDKAVDDFFVNGSLTGTKKTC
ncbi:MAG: alpha/beta hydrolase [Rhodoluna sp.]